MVSSTLTYFQPSWYRHQHFFRVPFCLNVCDMRNVKRILQVVWLLQHSFHFILHIFLSYVRNSEKFRKIMTKNHFRFCIKLLNSNFMRSPGFNSSKLHFEPSPPQGRGNVCIFRFINDETLEGRTVWQFTFQCISDHSTRFQLSEDEPTNRYSIN